MSMIGETIRPSSSTVDEKRRWFEPVSVILMAVASLSTAWCSYQNSEWSGQSSDLDARADRLEREASVMHLDARQIESMHTRMFMEAIDAQLEGDVKRAQFYTDRFAEELKPAYEKWLSLNPFESASSAPASPLDPELYVPRFQKEIKAAREESAVEIQIIIQQSKIVARATATIELNKVRKIGCECMSGKNDPGPRQLKLVAIWIGPIRVQNCMS